jgi:hypothetical protein
MTVLACWADPFAITVMALGFFAFVAYAVKKEGGQ